MLIKNARVVTLDEEFTGVVAIHDGAIQEVARGTTSVAAAHDWQGDYLLPGLVELHTDNLEKHLAPRPGVLWNTEAAFVIHDAQVAAAGITTVFDALAIGDRSNVGIRARALQVDCANAMQNLHDAGLLRADHLLHLRCEIATEDVVEAFDELREHALLRLVSVMDHTPGQRQWQDPQKWREYQERHGKWSDEQMHSALAELRDEQQRFAAAHRRAIVARCASLAIPLASHDDTLLEHVHEAAADGITISEFPTTLAAAQAARAHGMGIIMGAPNVVRGGSHSGNIPAAELARVGLLDILSSDYVPSSLLHAAFELRRVCDWSLARAVATVSANPARAVGLHERGEIAAGRRADLVRVRLNGHLPVPLATYRQGERIA
jgi:alpha-D-ribose 1-methylphosphonate 5-triphosphate diphosphatase